MQSDGVKNIRPLGFQWATSDPFLFCVHHEDFYPAGKENMGPDPQLLAGRLLGQDFQLRDGWRMYHGTTVPGFPSHPHCGFETVTIVRNGYIDHSDSMGGYGRFGKGDVQWMTAGRGVQHAEMFPLLHSDKGNPVELFQIWLNLPAAAKKAPPHYTMFWRERIPVYRHHDSYGRETVADIIAGQLYGRQAPSPPPDSWAADPAHAVGIWHMLMEPGAEFTLPPAAAGVNRSLYFYKGKSLQINGHAVEAYHAIDADARSSLKLVNGDKTGMLLVLQGKPIGEPVVQHGPFVTTTYAEIHEAIRNYQRTGFGGWPWPVNDPVHPRHRGRFAHYSDGKEENISQE
ncbi:MAG: hypothetical protein KatS3mg031_2603 [Chitinophagales bacterium]|nr:MAG: hypothetical protein KatS3mg031_2603 [Chitinophagales bacterium]